MDGEGFPVYVIIVGLSGVGESLARALINRGHTVAIIDKNEDRCNTFASEVDALVICGDAGDKENLDNAGADKADALVVATGDDSVNLMVGSLGKEFKIPRLVSVVRDPEHIQLFNKIGTTITPDEIVAEHLYQSLFRIRDFLLLGNNEAEIFTLRVEKDSKVVNKPATEIRLPNGYTIMGVFRRGKLALPSKDLSVQPEDEVLIHANKLEGIKKIVELFTGKFETH